MEECEGGRGDGGLGACRVTAGMVKNYDDDEASLDCCGKTHAHNATYGEQTRSLIPSATIVAPALVPTPTAIPVDKFDGYVWGYSNTSHVYRSADGITWTQHCATPGGGQLSRLVPTTDGEVVLATFTGVYKSSGWSSTDASGVTWSQKVTANGKATINRFCFDGNGQKFIVTNYGPGAGQAWIDSRYAWISVDAGETWTLAYDTEVQTPNVGTDSHIHGVCYDPWDDIFIVSEGHNTGYGMYVSTDDGATWNLWDGRKMPMQPSPTCVVATNDGIVCTSDSEDAGMWGIVREGPLHTRKLRRTWRWSGAGRAGVIGFGQHAFRDPDTGVVYCGFQSTTAGESPIICAATAETASLLVGWDQSVLATVVGDSWRGVVAHDGKLIAGGNFGGQSGNYAIIARLPRPGAPVSTDEGNTRGGVARSNSSVAVGPYAVVPGIDYQAVAVGGRSVARALSVAVGERAEITEGSNRGTAVGNGAKSATSAVAVGDAANAANFATSVGSNSSATGSRTAAFGSGATASAADSTALGHGSGATGAQATAVGRNAQATHTNSVAHGFGTATSAVNQHAFGARHFAYGSLSADPAIPPEGALYTWWKLNVDGVTWEWWSRVPGTGAKKLLLSTAP